MPTVATLNARLGLNSDAFNRELDKAGNKLSGFGKSVKEMKTSMRQSGLNDLTQMLRGAGLAAGLAMVGRAANTFTSEFIKGLESVQAGTQSASQAVITLGANTARQLPIFGEFYQLGQNLREIFSSTVFGTETLSQLNAQTAAIEKQNQAFQKELDTIKQLANERAKANVSVMDEVRKNREQSETRIKEMEREQRIRDAARTGGDAGERQRILEDEKKRLEEIQERRRIIDQSLKEGFLPDVNGKTSQERLDDRTRNELERENLQLREEMDAIKQDTFNKFKELDIEKGKDIQETGRDAIEDAMRREYEQGLERQQLKQDILDKMLRVEEPEMPRPGRGEELQSSRLRLTGLAEKVEKDDAAVIASKQLTVGEKSRDYLRDISTRGVTLRF